MKISTKGRYALTVMMDLATNGNEDFISLKDISERQKISNKYLEQIVAKLNKAGYLQTARGNNGGTEGDLAPLTCLENGAVCEKKSHCKTIGFWEGLDKVINDYVDSKTLADLLK